ncbi:hypothetical protein [Dictyobacter arantiisoli]|uniref:IPT/TIG domain-containing protein n=1 Tax=Dictyobacter arantiisoli TaxID=2014874 RepID=A0A5A5TFU2_9CHLR|nr:hypothetical protein [Dictyobacter arantiisoli]GCF10085.1 hypothetical protein KDI_36490 [Dictyobacter arantiisoli]
MLKNIRRLSLGIFLAGTSLGALTALLMLFFAGGTHTHTQHVRLAIGQNPAIPGSTVMVTGFDYTAAKKVEVYFQDRSNGIVRATTNAGGFFNTQLTLPKHYISGPAYVYVVSDNTTTKTPLNFVKTALKYVPAHPVGPRANLHMPHVFHGMGFLAHEAVRLTLRNGANTASIPAVQTDDQGHFSVSLGNLDIPFNAHTTLLATDSANKQVVVDVPNPPAILLYPSDGRVGSTLSVGGVGFAAYEAVKVFIQNKIIAVAVANKSGQFFTSFQVPPYASINYYLNSIKAVGIKSHASASTSFQVQPSANLQPKVSVPNQPIKARGSQFTPSGQVQVLLFDPGQSASSAGIPVGILTASKYGTINSSLITPNIPAGSKNYKLVFIDETTGVSTSSPILIF